MHTPTHIQHIVICKTFTDVITTEWCLYFKLVILMCYFKINLTYGNYKLIFFTLCSFLVFRQTLQLTICCILYIIAVRSYNSLIEMPVLQNCLNFDYSPNLSHCLSQKEKPTISFVMFVCTFVSFLSHFVPAFSLQQIGSLWRDFYNI